MYVNYTTHKGPHVDGPFKSLEAAEWYATLIEEEINFIGSVTISPTKGSNMKAIFSATINEIEAATIRAGLVVRYPIVRSAILTGDRFQVMNDGELKIEQKDSSLSITSVRGTPNSVMRLIGALADDGQECLVSAV